MDRKAYFFISSFFAAFFEAFLSAFFPSFFIPSFFISSFFIGAPAWDAASAKPLDTAKTAATNSDMSFFIQLSPLSVIRMIRSPETGQPRGIVAYIVERAKDSPDVGRAARWVPPAPPPLARIGK